MMISISKGQWLCRLMYCLLKFRPWLCAYERRRGQRVKQEMRCNYVVTKRWPLIFLLSSRTSPTLPAFNGSYEPPLCCSATSFPLFHFLAELETVGKLAWSNNCTVRHIFVAKYKRQKHITRMGDESLTATMKSWSRGGANRRPAWWGILGAVLWCQCFGFSGDEGSSRACGECNVAGSDWEKASCLCFLVSK